MSSREHNGYMESCLMDVLPLQNEYQGKPWLQKQARIHYPRYHLIAFCLTFSFTNTWWLFQELHRCHMSYFPTVKLWLFLTYFLITKCKITAPSYSKYGISRENLIFRTWKSFHSSKFSNLRNVKTISNYKGHHFNREKKLWQV